MHTENRTAFQDFNSKFGKIIDADRKNIFALFYFPSKNAIWCKKHQVSSLFLALKV